MLGNMFVLIQKRAAYYAVVGTVLAIILGKWVLSKPVASSSQEFFLGMVLVGLVFPMLALGELGFAAIYRHLSGFRVFIFISAVVLLTSIALILENYHP